MVTLKDLETLVPNVISELEEISRRINLYIMRDLKSWKCYDVDWYGKEELEKFSHRRLVEMDSFANILVEEIDRAISDIKSNYNIFTRPDMIESFVNVDFTEFKQSIEAYAPRFKDGYNKIMRKYGLPKI